ncbi:MAG: flavodoxin-dependent (E)-4-hydroxy-3-methylbut-2-enyl-diphosphate synthase [Ruminococcaceae bacterium]|nr:flavodoxin-dependent (E)-4-hydroxy-3-methylbut-2-enyl-diphosphate synthase [Oscillospiraceae bacterium]
MIYNDVRRKTKEIKIGNIAIGGASPIAIQSMTNTDTHDKKATLDQIMTLQRSGCDIIRITVPDIEAADTIPYLKENGVTIPVVADIHFDYKIALRCAEVGVDKIRINPGNIGADERVREVVCACKKAHIPIRIGVNSGSLEKEILAKYSAPTPEALCESAMYHVSLLEKYDFDDIVISIKASDPYNMIKANRLLAEKCRYPLHLGVTEAGSREIGSIKSAVGIGALLCDGIGDTVRVSLTNDPIEEIAAAKSIFNAVGIEGQRGLDLVSCPTCGRTKIDLISLVSRFLDRAKEEEIMDKPIKVAIMGCVVNGPGEAREADIGVAGGKGEAVLIKKGVIIEKIPEGDIVERLIAEIKTI